MNDDERTQSLPTEVEIKLFVPPSSVDRVWSQRLVVAHAIGPRQVVRLTNRYFDTADRDLAKQRMALRLRGDGAQWVQTLKTGGAGHGALSERGEWEQPVDGPALDWTKLAATPLANFVASVASRRKLRVLFTTDFTRESQRLRLSDGSEVELAFDRGTIVADGDSEKVPICEIEVEIKQPGRDDSPAALLRFAARLARSLPLIPLAASKAARGHALASRAPTVVAKVTLPQPVADDVPARHLAGVLAACNEALLANVHVLLGVAADGDPIEPVHQARVAIRRMRSALRLFRPGVDGRRLRTIDERLQELGRLFGTVRDADVFVTTTLPRLEGQVGRDPAGRDALVAIRDMLEVRRSEARRRLMAALDTGTFGATTLDVERMAMRLASSKATGPLLGAAAARWLPRQYARVVGLARRLAVLDEAERHGLRIEVKRLRYAIDLFDALYADDALAAFHASLAGLQDRLGQLNDEAVAQTVLRSLPSSPAVAPVLARDEAWFAGRLQRQLPKVAAEVMKLELAVRPWTVERQTPPDRR